MLFLIKPFPEITIKSKPVRARFMRFLARNLRRCLAHRQLPYQVECRWDHLRAVPLAGRETAPGDFLELAGRVPGISHIEQIEEYPLEGFADLLEKVLLHYQARLAGKSFAVRCKRVGCHDFCSRDVEVYVGRGLCERAAVRRVDLSAPEITVRLEIRHQHFYVMQRPTPGLGGFPLGSMGTALSLLSGGFDSAVSSYMTMRRGLGTHFCFFNLGGAAHEAEVRAVALHLWRRYGISHKTRLFVVPFDEVLEELFRSIGGRYRGVVLKRMMLRVASRLAAQHGCGALVTGESVGQVSSQTLSNLRVIDEASDCLVLRPLSTMDKRAIIALAEEIRVRTLVESAPEYCAVVSEKPATRAASAAVEHQEGRFDAAVLERALAAMRVLEVARLPQLQPQTEEVEVQRIVRAGQVVIDIAAPGELSRGQPPLAGAPRGVEVLHIPFYELRSTLPGLSRGREYLLYCEQGVLSRLQVAALHRQGYCNLKVYQPLTQRQPPASEEAADQ